MDLPIHIHISLARATAPGTFRTGLPRWTSTIKFRLNENPHSTVSGAYVYFGLAKYWAQNDIYSALYTELPSFATRYTTPVWG